MSNLIFFTELISYKFCEIIFINKIFPFFSTFRNSEPKNIERAKGLGSLNDLEIGESTLSPENRKLLRYTTQDISNEIEEIRRVNDDKFKLIENVDISQYEF